MADRSGGLDRSFLLVVRILGFTLAGAVGIVLARVLGPDHYATYASATALVALVFIAQSWGLDQLFLQRRTDLRGLQAGLSLVSLTSAVVVLLVALLWPGLSGTTRICVVLLGFAMSLDILKSPYLLSPQRELQFGRRAIRELWTRSGRLVVVLIVAALLPSAITVAIIALVVAVILLIPTEGRLVLGRQGFSAENRARLRAALPYAASGALYTLSYQADMVLLTTLAPGPEVAFYKAAYNLVDAAVLIPVVLNNDIMRPRLVHPEATTSDRARIVRTSALLSIGFGLAAAAVLCLGRGPIVDLLYGDAYARTAALLLPLGLSLPLLYAASALSNSLIATGFIQRVLVVQGGLAFMNIVLNCLLIPMNGADGAAVATLLTEGAGVFCFVVAYRTRIAARIRRPDRGREV